jgi:hypothetical protein
MVASNPFGPTSHDGSVPDVVDAPPDVDDASVVASADITGAVDIVGVTVADWLLAAMLTAPLTAASCAASPAALVAFGGEPNGVTVDAVDEAPA